MPFIWPHLALMPAAHLGKGATVGSVIPTSDAIIPAAVGVDIGCGMMAVRTQFTADDVADRDLTALHRSIARAVPLSAGAVNREVLPTAQRFALLNREEMMDRVVEQTRRFFDADVEQAETLNCHHDYTERETHLGREVWLSRKGAISAREGQEGLIPGSMGTASYVVTGRGNAPSLMSSPHGAGRTFSRTAACRRFTRADLDQRLPGIAWGHSDAFLDEHPDADKAIDIVMADAADLVEVRHALRQFVNVKGD